MRWFDSTRGHCFRLRKRAGRAAELEDVLDRSAERRASVDELPLGALDGIVIAPGGRFFVSSWEAAGIYARRAGRPWSLAVKDVPTPADLGFDARRELLLVPSFAENRIELHPAP